MISGGAGVLFKGSGFYQTDYRSESYRKAEKAEKGSPSVDKGGDSGKSTSSSPGTSGSGD